MDNNAKLARPLVNHIMIIAAPTRFSVTSSWYLKCKYTETNLSTAMAAIVKEDVAILEYAKKTLAVKTYGHKNSKLLLPFAATPNIMAMIIAIIGWTYNTTARSAKARVMNNIFKLAGINEAFHRARMTRRFPRVATGEKTRCKMQSSRTKVGWNSRSIVNSFTLMEQKEYVMVDVSED